MHIRSLHWEWFTVAYSPAYTCCYTATMLPAIKGIHWQWEKESWYISIFRWQCYCKWKCLKYFTELISSTHNSIVVQFILRENQMQSLHIAAQSNKRSWTKCSEWTKLNFVDGTGEKKSRSAINALKPMEIAIKQRQSNTKKYANRVKEDTSTIKHDDRVCFTWFLCPLGLKSRS